MISSKKQSNIRIKLKKCHECRRKFKTISEIFIHLRGHKLKRRIKNEMKQKRLRVHAQDKKSYGTADQIEIDHNQDLDLCFKCDICEMKFNQLEDFKSHEKIHSKIIGATTTTLSNCLENQKEQNVDKNSRRNSLVQSEDLITPQCDLILNDSNNSFSCLDDRTQLPIELVEQCEINFQISSDDVNKNCIDLS